jgi:hypothetical protein
VVGNGSEWLGFDKNTFWELTTRENARKMVLVSKNGRKWLAIAVIGWKCVLWLGNERYQSKMGPKRVVFDVNK